MVERGTGAGVRAALRSVPDTSAITGGTAPRSGDVLGAALAVVERLCGRVVTGGGSTEPAPHGDVALALRDLVPAVDDAEFDAHMGAIARTAWFVTVCEIADQDEVAFAEAAWAASLDRGEFDHGLEGDAEFRTVLIAHWDDQLRTIVNRLVEAERGPAGRQPHPSTSRFRTA